MKAILVILMLVCANVCAEELLKPELTQPRVLTSPHAKGLTLISWKTPPSSMPSISIAKMLYSKQWNNKNPIERVTLLVDGVAMQEIFPLAIGEGVACYLIPTTPSNTTTQYTLLGDVCVLAGAGTLRTSVITQGIVLHGPEVEIRIAQLEVSVVRAPLDQVVRLRFRAHDTSSVFVPHIELVAKQKEPQDLFIKKTVDGRTLQHMVWNGDKGNVHIYTQPFVVLAGTTSEVRIEIGRSERIKIDHPERVAEGNARSAIPIELVDIEGISQWGMHVLPEVEGEAAHQLRVDPLLVAVVP